MAHYKIKIFLKNKQNKTKLNLMMDKILSILFIYLFFCDKKNLSCFKINTSQVSLKLYLHDYQKLTDLCLSVTILWKNFPFEKKSLLTTSKNKKEI